MAQNLLEQGFNPQPSTAAPTSQGIGGSLLESGLTPQAPPSAASSSSSAPAQAVGGSLLESGFTKTSAPSSPSPENGQPADEGILAKSLRLINTPLTESLLGWGSSRAGATGVEKAAEEIASGFTAPLSIALTLATFGTAGFLESAGASVLKDTLGMGAEQIAQIGKGAEITADALKTGKIGAGQLDAALKAADIDPAVYHGAMDTLYKAGLKEADLTSGDLVTRSVSQIARKVGLTPAQSQNVAKGFQTLASAGFAGQAAYTAVSMSPRVLDALKEGDYQHAAEYATEAVATGLFAVAGASHFLKTAGELVDPLNKAKLRPTDEHADVKKLADVWNGDVKQGIETSNDFLVNNLKTLGHEEKPILESVKKKNFAQLFKMYIAQRLGFDTDLATQGHNALAQAMGRDDRIGESPENGQQDIRRVYHWSPKDITEANPEFAGTRVDNARRASQLQKGVFLGENAYKEDLVQKGAKKYYTDLDYNRVYDTEKDPLGLKPKAAEIAYKTGGGTAGAFEKLVQDNGFEGYRWPENNTVKMFTKVPVKPFTEDVAPLAPRPLTGQPAQHPALPSNLQEIIANSPLKDAPDEYKDQLLAAFKGAAEGLTPEEMTVAKNARFWLDKELENGAPYNLIANRLEDYLTQVWDRPSPEINTLLHDANNGKFITQLSYAKHRAFGNDLLTPLLKGYKLKNPDPIRLTAKYIADTERVIASKKMLAAARSAGVRTSQGAPAVILSGEGHTVDTGDNPATFITPQRVQNILIDDKELARLAASGDLQRRLDSGSIVDVTPRAHTWDIPGAIDRLEKRMISAPIKYDAEGNAINLRDLNLLKAIRDGKRPMSDLDEYNASQKPMYVWRTQGYISPDHPAFHDWKFLTKDLAGNDVQVDSNMLVSPEYAPYLMRRLGLEESDLQKRWPTRALLKGGVAAKKVLLGGSPFHGIQELLRTVMTGIVPWAEVPSIEGTAPDNIKLRRGVENRLTLHTDSTGLQSMSEGLSGGFDLLRKIPGVGSTLANSLDWYQHTLFNRIIPNMKARAYLKMYDEYEAAHPDYAPDKIAELAAQHTNDSFGGQDWAALGRSTTSQDWARLTLLAHDWLEGEMRSTARLFNRDEGGIGRAEVAKMAMLTWGVARVLNLLTTGKMHNEAPFGLAVKNDQGKETVYSVRTLPTDMLHMATDPVGFLRGRLSPFVRAGTEIYTGRDQYDRKLSKPDMAVDLFRNIAPIPFQAVGQVVSGTSPETGNVGQFVKAVGGTATSYRTEAQKLAANLASNHSEDGIVDPAQLARHRVIMDFEDQLRQGKMTNQQLNGLVIGGQLPQADAKKITENLRTTRNLTPDMASLYTRVSRLPAKELLDVYDLSTDAEKQALAPLVLKARRTYTAKAMKELTPVERLRDPVLRRLANVRTDQPLF